MTWTEFDKVNELSCLKLTLLCTSMHAYARIVIDVNNEMHLSTSYTHFAEWAWIELESHCVLESVKGLQIFGHNLQ